MKMNLNKMIRSNVGFILCCILVLSLFVSTDAKTFVLKSLLKTGLYSPDVDSAPNTGMDASALSFKSLDGRIINLSEEKGKVIFINFWTTWCPPCRAEMPSINSLYEKVGKNSNVLFLMVDADNKLVQANKFMKKRSFQLPVFGAVSPIPEQIFAGALPTTLIISPRGEIVFRHEGIANYDSQKLISFIRGLLAN